MAIGNAIVQCAKAVRDAGFLEVDEAEDAGALPKWSEVPKECGFKIAQPGERGQRHRATEEEKVAQCRAYGQFKNWARKACGLAAEEVKVHLAKAAGLHWDMCGRGDLPQAFRRQHHSVDTDRVTAREHAVLLCRVPVPEGREQRRGWMPGRLRGDGATPFSWRPRVAGRAQSDPSAFEEGW